MNQSLDQIKQYLSDNLSSGRMKHTKGVVETAKAMAKEFGASEEKAELAGWLHDIAKEYKAQQLLEEAYRLNIQINKIDTKSPHILHSRVGAKVAQEKFDIQDEEVLNAIEQHTLGKPDMHLLEKILFVADSIEPNRPKEWSEPIRHILRSEGLNAAIAKCCQNSINEITEKKLLLHPLTIDTYNFYVINDK